MHSCEVSLRKNTKETWFSLEIHQIKQKQCTIIRKPILHKYSICLFEDTSLWQRLLLAITIEFQITVP